MQVFAQATLYVALSLARQEAVSTHILTLTLDLLTPTDFPIANRSA